MKICFRASGVIPIPLSFTSMRIVFGLISLHVIRICTFSPPYFKAFSIKFWKTGCKKLGSPAITCRSERYWSWMSACFSFPIFHESGRLNLSNISYRLKSLIFNRKPWASVDWSNIRLMVCNTLFNSIVLFSSKIFCWEERVL